MNPDTALKVLNITLGDSAINAENLIKKSFYEFDLHSLEGITSFLEILPITSDELLMQAMQEVWPGFPTDNFDVKRARFELRGYFLDYLNNIPEDLEVEEEMEEVDDDAS